MSKRPPHTESNVQVTVSAIDANPPSPRPIPEKRHLEVARQRDFRDTPEHWRKDPIEAYKSWIAHFDLRHSTREIKVAMWSKFVRWLASRGRAVAACAEEDVTAFLNGVGQDRAPSLKAQRRRYIRLLEEVFLHLNGIGIRFATNPARQAARHGAGKGSNDDTRFLSPDERERLCHVLREVFSSGELEALDEAGPSKLEWTDTRDAAIAALMLGAGLRVTEAVQLTVNCTLSGGPAVIEIPDLGDGKRKSQIKAHNPKVLPIARAGIQAWARVCQRHKIDVSRVMFPPALDRRRDGLEVKVPYLHPATVYRGVRRVLTRAGIVGDRATGQTLRNTYAAMLFDDGVSDDDVQSYLGFFMDGSAPRLREAYAVAAKAWNKSAET